MAIWTLGWLFFGSEAGNLVGKIIAKDHTKLSPEETRPIGLVLC
jgi:hypothetical protein